MGEETNGQRVTIREVHALLLQMQQQNAEQRRDIKMDLLNAIKEQREWTELLNEANDNEHNDIRESIKTLSDRQWGSNAVLIFLTAVGSTIASIIGSNK